MSFALPNVLLLISNPHIIAAVNAQLATLNIHLFQQTDHAQALGAVLSFRPEIIICDEEFSKASDYSVFHRLKSVHPAPILEIRPSESAPSTSNDKLGIQSDLIISVSDFDKLGQHIQDLITRFPLPKPKVVKSYLRNISVGSLKINRYTKEVWLGDKSIALNEQEYNLLIYLVINANCVMNTDELVNYFKESKLDKDAIDWHIARLRKILRDDKKAPKKIRTVEGGYLFEREAWT
ncbi:response regulator transcription factor [Sessilibacter sp. MAH4]